MQVQTAIFDYMCLLLSLDRRDIFDFFMHDDYSDS